MLSAYEEARLKSIAENKAKLIELGLETAVEQCRSSPKPPTTSSNKKQKVGPPPLTEDQRAALADASNVDVHDRALFYYRLLSTDVDRLLAKVPAAHLQCGIFELYFG